MKKLNILFLVLCAISFTTKSNAQNAAIPNAGFELWSPIGQNFPKMPNGWVTSDLLYYFSFADTKTVTKTADKKSGSAAMLLKRDTATLDVFSGGVITTVFDTLSCFVYTGDFLKDKLGFYSKTRPSALTGFYKLKNPDKDTASIVIAVDKYDENIQKSVTAGIGRLILPASDTYTNFIVPILYDANVQGTDTIFIGITCGSDIKKSLKTELTVDDLGLTYPVSTDEFEAVPISIYPNPAFEYAYFDFSAISAAKNIELFDIQGRLVNTSVIENNLFQLSLADFSTGTYAYKVTDAKNNLVKTGKIEVLK